MAAVAVEALPSGEAIPDYNQSPTWSDIEAAFNYFMQQCDEVDTVAARAPLALAMVGELRSNLWQGGLAELQDPLRLRLKTQLDVTEWLAWNDLWYYHNSKTIEVPGMEGPRKIRQEEYSAANQLLDDIEIYHISFAGDPETAYDELLDSFHTARRVIKNPQEMLAVEKNVDNVALVQKLSIYQTINALHASGFMVRRPTLTEKDKKIDVIVQAGKNLHWDIPIRLQPGSQQSGELEIMATKGLLFVDLPYSIVRERPFVMGREDRITLASGVKEMWARSLAMKFGTEAINASLE